MDQQYTVDGNLNHDNRLYKTGDTIVLSDKDAAPLLAIGRVKLPETPAPAEQPAPQAAPAPAPQPQPQAAPQQQVQAPAAPQASAPAEQAKPQTGQPTPEDIARTAAEVN